MSTLHTRACESQAVSFYPRAQLLLAEEPMALSPLPGAQLGDSGKATDKEAVPGTGDTCPRTGLPSCSDRSKGRAPRPRRPRNEWGRRAAPVLPAHTRPTPRQRRYTPRATRLARPTQPHVELGTGPVYPETASCVHTPSHTYSCSHTLNIPGFSQSQTCTPLLHASLAAQTHLPAAPLPAVRSCAHSSVQCLLQYSLLHPPEP